MLLNWDTISRKYSYQIQALAELGYSVHITTNDAFGNSDETIRNLPDELPVNLHVLVGSGVSRLVQSLSVLWRLRGNAVALLGVSSRTSWALRLVCGLLRIPVIAISWGDIFELGERQVVERRSIEFCLRTASLVWVKEPGMYPALKRLTKKPCFFLPNACEIPKEVVQEYAEREFDFVWVNRPVSGRRLDHVARALLKLGLEQETRSVLMGWADEAAIDMWLSDLQIDRALLSRSGIDVSPFGDPRSLFRSTRFMVLAADRVFGNNSLLEAMAVGVVPVVSRSPAIEMIVSPKSGLIIEEISPTGVYLSLRQAQSLSPENWQEMSVAARSTVRESFSTELWKSRAAHMLEMVSTR